MEVITRERLTDAELRTLVGVRAIGPCTSRELEAHLGLRKSAVYRYLSKLLAMELVEGEKATDVVGHRPPFLFSITDVGRSCLDDFEQVKVAELLEQISSLQAARE